MANIKDAIIASPEKTAYQVIDGKRMLLGYGNGSVFMASRPDLLIKYKLSPAELSKYIHRDWRPVDVNTK